METLFLILLNTFFVSAVAFVGILTLILKKKLLEKILLFFVSLSAGALIGGAFLHLLPEATEKFTKISAFVYVVTGFALFFLIEKILHWRHCHEAKCPVHSFAYMNLLGDAIHNFIDGLIIAASFFVNIPLGITTTLIIALHEIPQELGDFGVLIYGGFNKVKALLLNYICALAAMIGGTIGYFLSGYVESFVTFLLPIAAGGFIYIAASDLIPEIRKEAKIINSLISFLIFILGILIIYAIKFVEV